MKKLLFILFACTIVLTSFSLNVYAATDSSNYGALERRPATPKLNSSENIKQPAPQQTANESFNVFIKDAKTYPGETVVITVSGVPAGTAIKAASSFDFKPNFFESSSGVFTALFPINYRTAVGEYPITVSTGDYSKTITVYVQDKKFQTQNMQIDTSVAQNTVNNKSANNQFENYIAPLRSIALPDKYFNNSDFIWPVGNNAKVTTEFGMIRYVNGAPTSTRHGGIDFAVPRGTPVKAANSGKVLFAGNLQLTGNTVVIEHGYGLKSWYYHMDSLGVKTNDIITAGQVVGKVGSTGFSSGPHLHFAMSVNNVFVNPKTIIDTKLLKGI